MMNRNVNWSFTHLHIVVEKEAVMGTRRVQVGGIKIPSRLMET